jgi:hypothetical protein
MFEMLEKCMKAYSLRILKAVSIWLLKQDDNVVATISAPRIIHD